MPLKINQDSPHSVSHRQVRDTDVAYYGCALKAAKRLQGQHPPIASHGAPLALTAPPSLEQTVPTSHQAGRSQCAIVCEPGIDVARSTYPCSAHSRSKAGDTNYLVAAGWQSLLILAALLSMLALLPPQFPWKMTRAPCFLREEQVQRSLRSPQATDRIPRSP